MNEFMQRYHLKYVTAIGGLLVCGVVSISSIGLAQKKNENVEAADDNVDHLQLVSVLIKDKHFDRARTVLAELDVNAPGVDRAAYYLLSGLTELSLQNAKAALDALVKSIEAGQEDPMVHVFAAQACFRLERYADVVSHLNRAGDAGRDMPAIFMLNANAHWKLNRLEGAWEALSDGIAAFPDDLQLQRMRVLLLVDAGLFRQAQEDARHYLAHPDISAEDYTVIGEALLKGGAHEDAILILEAARLSFPDAPELTLQLAKAYMKAEMEMISARLFHLASMEDYRFAADAAELYRRQGKFYWALRLNEQIVDQKIKIRQRVGILIETEKFEEAVALIPRLQRLGLLGEDAIVYGVAYAYFKIGQFSRAETYLSQLTESMYFNRAMELRMAISRCQAAGWQCE